MGLLREQAESIGLTVHQLRMYALWFTGFTQDEIAARLQTTQDNVAKCIGRARRRNPALPLPTSRRGLSKLVRAA
jgi:transcriptional regulator